MKLLAVMILAGALLASFAPTAFACDCDGCDDSDSNVSNGYTYSSSCESYQKAYVVDLKVKTTDGGTFTNPSTFSVITSAKSDFSTYYPDLSTDGGTEAVNCFNKGSAVLGGSQQIYIKVTNRNMVASMAYDSIINFRCTGDRPASPTNRPVSPTNRPVSPTNRPVSPTTRPASPTREPTREPTTSGGSSAAGGGGSSSGAATQTCSAESIYSSSGCSDKCDANYSSDFAVDGCGSCKCNSLSPSSGFKCEGCDESSGSGGSSGGGSIVGVVLGVLFALGCCGAAVAGGAYYMMVLKPKQDADDKARMAAEGTAQPQPAQPQMQMQQMQPQQQQQQQPQQQQQQQVV